jgi:ABC-type transport system substrate-binding protein
MLVSSFAGINVAPVKAYEFTLVATVTQTYWGYYYIGHPIWAAIKNDLAAIGINLELREYSDFDWYDRVFGGWNKSWAEGGWDLTNVGNKLTSSDYYYWDIRYNWWLQPHALDPWFTSLVRSDLTPVEGGCNIAPWNNSDADELLRNGMSEFNALTRQLYMHKWQEMFMDDPPWINLYYPKVFEVMGRYITGYDPTACRFYETQYLNLNNTMLHEARPGREPNTAIYAISEGYWALSPMFMDTYTDEQASTLQWRTLYKWSCDPFPTDGSVPSLEDYAIVPDMAADYPEYLNGGLTVRVTLRDGMVWRYNNGTTVPITADDVVWTYNTMLNPQSGCTGTGDFIHVIDNVTKVNATTVDFNLKYTCPDILSILSNDWGTGCILPKHKLASIPLTVLNNHPSNTAFDDPAEWLPVSGPFMLDPANPPEPDVDITLIRNPSYYGYGLGWGPYNVDKFILWWIKDPSARLTGLINNDIDFGEYPISPVQTFKDLNNTVDYPYLRVVQYDYPASYPIWFNFNNEYLSNRYIRMAIAHAIDYDYIINTLLPPWGIETAIRGKTPILPQHYYTDENGTTVQLFNAALSPYVQNVTKAQAYMDRWKKSQVGYTSPYPGGIYLEGAAGDADFSGKVDLDDFYIWRDKGWPLVYPNTVTFLPGQDIDPDFNNDGSYDLLPDYIIWYDETYDLTYP